MSFPWPFRYVPDERCRAAAARVTAHVEKDGVLLADARRGKMFGVLTASDAHGEEHTLYAYSGLLAGRNDWPWFVPPIYDAMQPDGVYRKGEQITAELTRRIEALEAKGVAGDIVDDLRRQRHLHSAQLQQWLFERYRLLNARGEERSLLQLWRDYHPSPRLQSRFPLPPSGTGDCCAPKLLQEAYRRGLRPRAMAEFWYGESPRGEVRHHLSFYPPCRGKCLPLLTWMLQGLEIDGARFDEASGRWVETSIEQAPLPLHMVYEDASLFVIEKPAGMLSVPGRTAQPSVQSLLRPRCEDYHGPMMVHRLDEATSGLLVVARCEAAYQSLQRQFALHTISKTYEALLQGVRPDLPPRGEISLPLRPDPLDRPRQVADRRGGKEAVTTYEVMAVEGGITRVRLTPLTGRTHQLRMHCSHAEGLALPIVGDALYGLPPLPGMPGRLCLHAAGLAFTHPLTGEKLTFYSPPPF